MNNIDSHYIKEALMHYFRFKRGWVCADEVMSGNFIADILVDTGKLSMEVEIKTTKNDLYGGRGIKCLITLEEIKKLWFRDKAYLMNKPSIDREDNDGDYIYGNCRFIEQGHNSAERNRRVSSKPIIQFDLEGNFIKEWESIIEAEKELKINHSNISKCAKEIYKSASGYVWRYK